MPHQVIYSSKAVQPMSARQLEEILEDARAGNEARNVTGALVYADGVFLQVLEGEREVVQSLIESIRSDSRHESMKVFHQREVARRAFDDWRMAYLGSSSAQMSRWADLPGTQSIDQLLERVQTDPDMMPRILIRIVEAIASQSGKV